MRKKIKKFIQISIKNNKLNNKKRIKMIMNNKMPKHNKSKIISSFKMT